ncbi:UDP-N-acetylmuramoyl-L-alanyl-D-glutamate--2,6-diaminopimelate ligase [Gayadomonas joobiniege]|uniref:UDP-N-acetylmuramoyl-L-alanyl-D-glutamate--2, 6-diaminopimelate ligase n=1 Tax=Gayadomonas joobiniege TaxID=1234606 RepID=UPI00035D979F|nr:UDP-N-acetylmuramoyl-L-alanyl-D-glutamate--2,6-diaminopimelate ligase [Gayadomonas joobiniege]
MPDLTLAFSQYLAIDLPAIKIIGIALDSRLVKPGDAFMALAGRQNNALDYADQAIANGAVIIFSDDKKASNKTKIGKIPVVYLPNLRKHVSYLAAIAYQQPAKHLYACAVTGTNGKTSVADFIYQLSLLSGQPAGYIGTLGAHTKKRQLKTGLTTPDAVKLQQILAGFVQESVELAAIEVSSHAIDQHRAAGVDFDALVFTNLSHEHLDYHGTIKNYFACKASLFSTHKNAAAVINMDDQWGQKLFIQLQADNPGRQLIAISCNPDQKQLPACLSANNIQADEQGFSFDLHWQQQVAAVRLNLLGEFNISNLLQAIAVLLLKGHSLNKIAPLCSQLTATAGRMQSFKNKQQVFAVVDFAHTPDALEKALLACRLHCQKRVHLVFGCGGDRDTQKRPLMGEIAARLADSIYLSNDNPRSEDPKAIMNDILQGIADSERVSCIPDRQQAIAAAVKNAQPQDWVLIAGKGHETEQIFAEQTSKYDERAFVSQLMEVNE